MPLSLDDAQRLIAAGIDRAQELGIRVTLAVVDEGGLLQALGRMDGAFPLSAQIAEAKAAGAALWHRDGAALVESQRDHTAFFEQANRLTRLPIMPAKGSVLIRRDGAVLGAVGVSGASGEVDLECAAAGLGALELSGPST
jgi:glc operon protein GlcG